MKKQMAMLLAVVFLAAICSGCQPTLERPPIVGKGDGKLEQIVASGAPESGTPAPEAENPAPQPQDLGELRWKETYTVSNLICKFDPEIIVPENMIFPVYEARQTAFTLDSVQPLVEYFTQGAQGMREAYPTKEELESQLIHVKRGNYVIQDDYRAWEPYEGQEEDIKALEEQIRSARAEEFTEVQPLTVLPTNMIYKLPNGKRAHIVAKDRSFYFYTYGESAYMQLESLVLDGEAYPGEPEGSRIEPQISEEEAKQAAQELTTALGFRSSPLRRRKRRAYWSCIPVISFRKAGALPLPGQMGEVYPSTMKMRSRINSCILEIRIMLPAGGRKILRFM